MAVTRIWKPLIVSYLVFAFSFSKAQPIIKTELSKVNKAYALAENLSMDVVVFTYKDKNDKTGNSFGNGWIKKSGKNYHSKFGKDEMLINGNVNLIIDNQKKTILVFEPHNNKIKQAEQMPDVDSMLTSMDSVAYMGEDADSKHFCFYDKDALIKQTDIYVYKKNSLVKRIIYYYKESTKEESYGMYKVIIDYKNIKLDKLPESDFSENKYITVEHGKAKLAPAYQSYKLNISENE